jgi:hypothetical protein
VAVAVGGYIWQITATSSQALRNAFFSTEAL